MLEDIFETDTSLAQNDNHSVIRIIVGSHQVTKVSKVRIKNTIVTCAWF